MKEYREVNASIKEISFGTAKETYDMCKDHKIPTCYKRGRLKTPQRVMLPLGSGGCRLKQSGNGGAQPASDGDRVGLENVFEVDGGKVVLESMLEIRRAVLVLICGRGKNQITL